MESAEWMEGPALSAHSIPSSLTSNRQKAWVDGTCRGQMTPLAGVSRMDSHDPRLPPRVVGTS